MTELALIREDQVPHAADDLLARDAAWPQATAGLVCYALGAGALGYAGYNLLQGAIAGPLGFGISGLLVILVGSNIHKGWWAARRATNWRLRATRDGLYVKFRSFRAHGLPAEDPVVVFVPRRSVTWLRRHDQRMVSVRRAAGKSVITFIKRMCLELKVDGSLAALDAAIAQERRRWIPTRFGPMRFGHFPVSVVPGDIVRIDWYGPDTMLRPKIDAALAHLARFGYRLADAQRTVRRSDLKGAGPEHEEQLLEHAQRGETIDAISLARSIYGYDPAEAKRFVEELRTGIAPKAE